VSHVFFTDRNLGRKFGQVLRAAGLTVEQHGDHFAHDCPDEEWLEGVGAHGWVAIAFGFWLSLDGPRIQNSRSRSSQRFLESSHFSRITLLPSSQKCIGRQRASGSRIGLGA